MFYEKRLTSILFSYISVLRNIIIRNWNAKVERRNKSECNVNIQMIHLTLNTN